MRILLLGAQGMLGHALAEVFANEDVTGMDKEAVDITDTGAVQHTVEKIQPEIIINAAAYTAVDAAEKERAQAFAVNAAGVENIAKAAKTMGATVVHYSTDYIFAGDKKEGYTEDDPPGPPINVYAESKLAGEEALKQISPRYYLVRTAWLYGAHGKNFVDTMLRLGKEKGKLRVINDQYGSPTYAKDLAHATQKLLDGYEPATYHLVNEGVTTWYEFARAIFASATMDVAVQPIPTSEYPLPARRPSYGILRRTRGPKLRSWHAALDEYIKSK